MDRARQAATELLARLNDHDSLDTAHYMLCGFVEAAAKLALEEPHIALRIAAYMPEWRGEDKAI